MPTTGMRPALPLEVCADGRTPSRRVFPVEEDDGGTYIMNSRDLCMIDYIPELIAAGINSFKIEGRAKSAYYAACVTNAYRHGIDAAAAGRLLEPCLGGMR